MYVIYWYKIVLYICAMDTVLIIVSYNSVKNGSLIYCCMIVLFCVLWPVIERWDLNKIKYWILNIVTTTCTTHPHKWNEILIPFAETVKFCMLL